MFGMIDPPRDCSVYDMSWVGPAAGSQQLLPFAACRRYCQQVVAGQMQRTVPVITFEGKKIEYGLGLHKMEIPGHGTFWGAGAMSMTRADGKRQMFVAVNLMRWNQLNVSTAMLFLEPESVEWAHFSDRGNGGLVQLSFDHRLRSFARSAAAGDAVAAQALVDHLIGQSVSYNPGIDPMVSQACEQIRQRLNRPITLAELARAVHRSPSRLAHRFREATGVPVRRFILWCRLRAAAESAMRGSSLTEAAHAAGFADSAHLSSTFRSMFGIAPSFLFKRGQLDVTFLQTPRISEHGTSALQKSGSLYTAQLFDLSSK